MTRIADVEQTVAIKQADIDTYREIRADGTPTVPWEALIMRGLTQNGCRNTTELRNLKYFNAENPKWRYYLEYYRYGSLHNLVDSYKEYNRTHPGRGYVNATLILMNVKCADKPVDRERIPEEFIWQAFNDLALAAYHMSTVRFDDVSNPGRDPYVLHLDLKHENGEYFLLDMKRGVLMRLLVLLGDAPGDKRKMRYPTLKVADWGE